MSDLFAVAPAEYTRVAMTDTLRNLVAKIATPRDRVGAGRFVGRTLTDVELMHMYYSNGLSAKVVNMPADDITRKWRIWDGDAPKLKALRLAEKKHRVQYKINKAIKLARLHGGSVLLMIINDGRTPDQPAIPGGKNSLKAIQVLSKLEIAPGEIDWNPESDNFGKPSYYFLSSPTNATNPDNLGLVVHHSRIVQFDGVETLEPSITNDGWGKSVLQRCYDELIQTATVFASSASLSLDAKTNVIQIEGLNSKSLNEEWRAKTAARFDLASYLLTNNSTLVLDMNEKFTQKTANFTGLPLLMQKFVEVLAAVCSMPVTRFLGTSPGGLGSTGAGELTDYYDTISSDQELNLIPRLDKLDAFLVPSALGTYPTNLDYKFPPLWEMSEKEAADLALVKASTTEIYAALGVIAWPALAIATQNQIIEDGIYPGLDVELSGLNGDARFGQDPQALAIATVKAKNPTSGAGSNVKPAS